MCQNPHNKSNNNNELIAEYSLVVYSLALGDRFPYKKKIEGKTWLDIWERQKKNINQLVVLILFW